MKNLFDKIINFNDNNPIMVNIILVAIILVLLFILKNMTKINILEGNSENIDKEIERQKLYSDNKKDEGNAIKDYLGDDKEATDNFYNQVLNE